MKEIELPYPNTKFKLKKFELIYPNKAFEK